MTIKSFIDGVADCFEIRRGADNFFLLCTDKLNKARFLPSMSFGLMCHSTSTGLHPTVAKWQGRFLMKINDLTIGFYFYIFVILFRIGSFFITYLYTLGQRYKIFVLRLQYANNIISEGTLFASRLLSSVSSAIYKTLYMVAHPFGCIFRWIAYWS